MIMYRQKKATTMNPSQLTVPPSAFDISKVHYSTVKIQDSHNWVYLNYANAGMMIIQTPDMYLPFGLEQECNNYYYNYYFDEKETWTLGLSFRDIESRPSLQKFFAFLRALENNIIDTAFQNSREWFGKQAASREIVADKFRTPLITYAFDQITGSDLITIGHP